MGKKQDPEGSAAPKATLFVRNLPYTMTQEQLEALFSDIGPIKKCFMIKDKESGSARGFAFVKFAMREDAVTATKTLDNKLYEGRKLALDFAKAKDRPKRKSTNAEAMSGSESEGEYDEDKGAPNGTATEGQEDSTAHVEPAKEKPSKRKAEAIEEAESEGGESDAPAHKLHKPVSQRAAPATADGRTLVLRNIPVGTAKSTLLKKCRKHGKVETFTFDEDDTSEAGEVTKTAHVVYGDYTHARTAAGKLDGGVCGALKLRAVIKTKDRAPGQRALKKSRLIVRNLPFNCTPEQLRTTFEPHGTVVEVVMPENESKKFKGFAFIQFTNVLDAGKAISAVNGNKIGKRPVAVDWTVPRDKYEAAVSSQAAGAAKRDGEKTSEGEDEGEDDGTGSELDEGDESQGDGEEEMEDESDEDDDDDSDDDDVEEKKPQFDGSDTAEGRTVFIRNVPFTATGNDIRTRLLEFGAIDFVKIVVNPDTQQPRGTAFAKFKANSDAEAAIAAASKAITVGGVSEGGVELAGRSLNISMAVDRAQAKVLETQNKEKDEKKDARNLWLAKEGYIERDTPAAVGVSPADLKKRERGWMDKKRKLKDPNFFISATRLSVRNIHTNIDEKKLREIFIAAVPVVDHNKPAVIKKVLLMRDPERNDKEGRPRSMGWAFIEFAAHEHALAALRKLNNNPEFFSTEKRLIVEFAVEDMKKAKLHMEKQAKALAAAPKDSDAAAGEAGAKKSTFKDFIVQRQAQRKKKQEARKNNEAKGAAVPATAAPATKAANNRKRGAPEGEVAAGKNNKRAKSAHDTEPSAAKGATKQQGAKTPAQKEKAPKASAAKKEQAAQPRGQTAQGAQQPKDKPSKADKKRDKKDKKVSADDAAEAKLDTLVAQYKKKLLGGSDLQQAQRWFE